MNPMSGAAAEGKPRAQPTSGRGARWVSPLQSILDYTTLYDTILIIRCCAILYFTILGLLRFCLRAGRRGQVCLSERAEALTYGQPPHLLRVWISDGSTRAES